MQVEEKYFDIKNKEKEDTADDKNELPTKLNENIKSIAKREGYKNFKIFQKKISTCGGNFLGDLILIDIKGKNQNGKAETNIFVKQIIPNDKMKFVNISEVYVRELFVYKTLSKIFTQLQDDSNVPLDERFKIAKFYEESNTEAIILENAVKRGFETLYKMDSMPIKFAEMSVKHLAKFHSLSLIMKMRMKIFFNEHLANLEYPIDVEKTWNDFSVNMFKLTLDALEGDPCKDRVQAFMDKTLEKFKHGLVDTSSPGCCLCHGDYRLNNILTKRMEGEVVDVLPVDYQTVYYGHPLQDFLYFIFLNSDQEFRRNHLTNLKDLYYDSMKQYLKYFSLDVEDVYPKMIFEKDYKERLDYGLLMSLMVIPVLFSPDDDVVDMGATEVKCNSVDPRFYDRIRGVIYDFIDWGYI